MNRTRTGGQVGRPRRAPSKEWLQKAYGKGWTYAQMVERWAKQSGHRVTSQAMRSAASRANVTGERTPRYIDYLPWTMLTAHQNAPEPRVLRLAKRRAEGLPNTDDQDRSLDLFLSRLAARNAVVYYDRDTPQGWWWVSRPDSMGAVDVTDPDTLRLRELPG